MMYSTIYIFCSLFCPGLNADEPEAALSTLENWNRAYGPEDLRNSVQSIRLTVGRGDHEVSARLEQIIKNNGLPERVRLEALKLACEKADQESAGKLHGLLNSWAVELDIERLNNPEIIKSKTNNFKTLAVTNYVKEIPNSLIEVLPQGDTIFQFLRVVAGPTWCANVTKSRCFDLVSRVPGSDVQRRDCAIKMIADMKRRTSVPGALLDLLNESSLPRLREMVRASSDPKTFHFGAAAALAYLGDREILPDLEARRPAFRKEHVNIEGSLIWFGWQIEVQHPPAKILTFIASKPREPVYSVEKRMWAVRRAAELKLPKARIRRAILDLADQVKPNKQGIRPGLISLKKQSLKLGILQAGDLRGVKIPKRGPTP